MPTIVLNLDSRGATKGLQEYQREAAKAAKSTDDLTNKQSSFDKMRSGINSVSSVMMQFAAVTAAAAAAFSAFAVKAASDLEEVQSKFDVVFKDMSESATAWAKTLQVSYGMSETESKKFLSSIQDLLVPMGMNSQAAASLSFEIVKLSTDLGSFNNLPTAKVMEDIQSALVGNYETMKKYGVVLNATTVQQKALEMGLAASKEELTASQKALAAYTIMAEDSSAAIGDFNRTQEGFANQMKIAKSTVNDLITSLGEFLLPIATDLVSTFNDWMRTQGGFNKVLGTSVEIVRFLYNGFMGLVLAAKGLTSAFGIAFDMIVDGLTGVLLPLDLLLSGFEKLGWIASNPLQELTKFTEDFKNAQTEAFTSTWNNVAAVNNQFDAMKLKLDESKYKTVDLGKTSQMSMEEIKKSVAGATNETSKFGKVTAQANQAAAQTASQVSIEMDNVGKAVQTVAVPAQQELNAEFDNTIKTAENLSTSIDTIGESAIYGSETVDQLTASTQNLTSVTDELAQSTAELGVIAKEVYNMNVQSLGGGGVAPGVYSPLGYGYQYLALYVASMWPTYDFPEWHDDYSNVPPPPTSANPYNPQSPYDPYNSGSSGSSVNVNVNQTLSRSDVVAIVSEMQRIEARQ